MENKVYLKKLTHGVFGSLADLILWNIYLAGSSFGKYGPRGIPQAFHEADEILEKYNHHTIAALWHQLKKKGCIIYQKRKDLYNPIITQYGRERLHQTIPSFHEKRPWDGKIYLVTYDIYETAHQKRNKLRRYLHDLGCRKLQESVWLSPYNIRELLNEYIQRNTIPGVILVSDIGKDGGVGETSLPELLTKVYELDTLDEKYETFIQNVSKKKKPFLHLIFDYLTILKEDPQLPFELLPSHYIGKRAYQLYQQLQNNYIQSLIRPDK